MHSGEAVATEPDIEPWRASGPMSGWRRELWLIAQRRAGLEKLGGQQESKEVKGTESKEELWEGLAGRRARQALRPREEQQENRWPQRAQQKTQ